MFCCSSVHTASKLLTPLSWPVQLSGTEQWESAEPGTCSRGSSCRPRRSPGWLGSFWATEARLEQAAAAGGGERTSQEAPGAAEAGPRDRESAAAVTADAAAPAGRGERQLWCSPCADAGGPAPGDWRCGESDGGGGGDVELAAERSDGDPATVGSLRSDPPPFARVRRCVGAASGSGFAGSGR